MNIQNWLMIEEFAVIASVVNIVVWDGNPDTWQPPIDMLMLPQATTTAMIWSYDEQISDFILVPVVGAGQIGFTWDGKILTTNQIKPSSSENDAAS